MKFVIDPRLEQDSEWVIDLPLCQVRLSNNAAFLWLILVPRKNDMVEIIDLDQLDQEKLLKEICQTSKIVKKLYKPKKLNIANLGNMVTQLHLHVVARFDTDPAWPNPVWNSGVTNVYSANIKHKLLMELKISFQGLKHD